MKYFLSLITVLFCFAETSLAQTAAFEKKQYDIIFDTAQTAITNVSINVMGKDIHPNDTLNIFIVPGSTGQWDNHTTDFLNENNSFLKNVKGQMRSGSPSVTAGGMISKKEKNYYGTIKLYLINAATNVKLDSTLIKVSPPKKVKDETADNTLDSDTTNGISINIYSGGTFDFKSPLSLDKIGGELVIKYLDIRKSRWGFYTGIHEFNNISFDSSNSNIIQFNTLLEPNLAVKADSTRYLSKPTALHQRVSSDQWGFYFKPVFRLTSFDARLLIGAAFHAEVLQVKTKVETVPEVIRTDTLTVRPNQNLVFNSGNGIFLTNYSTKTNGYFGISFPMFITEPKSLVFYFDPTIGLAGYSKSSILIKPIYNSQNQIIDRTREFITENKTGMFYMVRFRATEKYSRLNITIGGEIRGFFPNNVPSINLYLGTKINISKLTKLNDGE